MCKCGSDWDLEQKEFFIAYVLARDIGYRGDIFIFPVRDFAEIIRSAIPSKGRRKVYISRLHGEAERWVLPNQFTAVTDAVCQDVSKYRRNFAALLHA